MQYFFFMQSSLDLLSLSYIVCPFYINIAMHEDYSVLPIFLFMYVHKHRLTNTHIQIYIYCKSCNIYLLKSTI